MTRAREDGSISTTRTQVRRNGTFATKPSGIIIDELRSVRPKDPGFVVFLGAGASLSSRIETAPLLIANWARKAFELEHQDLLEDRSAEDFAKQFNLWRQGRAYDAWLARLKRKYQTVSEYGALFEYFSATRDERQAFVEQLVDGKRPGIGYVYMAALVAAGYFDTVFTTNFDDLLNDALVQYYRIKPIVCAFDSAVTSFNRTTSRPKIVKLHGDYLFSDIRNTESETDRLGTNMQDKLAEFCVDRPLIVLGYSGADRSVMDLLRKNLRRNPRFASKGLHWCVHTGSTTSSTVSRSVLGEKLANLAQDFPDRVFLYSSDGFDQFMLAGLQACGLSLPSSVLEPYASNLASDFYRTCEDFDVIGKLSTVMRAHQATAFDCLAKTQDGADLLAAMRADKFFRDARELQDAEDWKAASKLLRQMDDQIAPLMKRDGNLPPYTYWMVKRRYVGGLTSHAECKSRSSTNFTQASRKLLEHARLLALKLTEASAVAHGTAEEYYVRVLYNGLCACGMLWRQSLDQSSLRTDIMTLRHRMIACPSGWFQWQKFLRDRDSEALRADHVVGN